MCTCFFTQCNTTRREPNFFKQRRSAARKDTSAAATASASTCAPPTHPYSASTRDCPPRRRRFGRRQRRTCWPRCKFYCLQTFAIVFANFWRARSRLYQNEILQDNMRLTAFFKLYKICILLHRWNLKILAKTRFEKSAISVKIQQPFANVPNFAKFAK